MSNYPWCIVDASGVIVANFERKDIALACCLYHDNVHVEYRLNSSQNY